MSQPLPYDDIKFETENVCLEKILITSDDNDKGYFLEVDLEYPHNIRQKSKKFPFAPEKKLYLKMILVHIRNQYCRKLMYLIKH